eukprot:TRINITY_DN1935_c0_g1_i5.p1 TRINITY_DN1935_c0_g1~~TRINITY_DN1935_c0_g1_i5.p1  ORF type:complete len:230 (-),score=49.42 TRINITY_DN1935_c0_g1_i5:150-839(-)
MTTQPLQEFTVSPRAAHAGTLIWLHGLGDSYHGFSGSMGSLAPPSVKCVLPNAPMRPITLNGGFVMRGWFDMSGMGSDIHDGEDMEIGIDDSVAKIHDIIERESKIVPVNKIFIGGFSQGAVMAIRAGLTFKEEIGGIIACSGYVPQKDTLLTQLPKRDQKPYNKNTPIIAYHGGSDQVILQSTAEEDYKFLADSANIEIRFRSDADEPHTLTSTSLREIRKTITEWLQ